MGAFQAEGTARANAVPGGNLASLRICGKARVAGEQSKWCLQLARLEEQAGA